MSRPASQDNSTAVSLFPFLAVLLCTMGALVVLLVVMAQAASRRVDLSLAAAEAATEAESPASAPVDSVEPADPQPSAVAADDAPTDDNLRADVERAEEARLLAERREAQLTALRDKAANSLRDDQARLSHVEDHIRRLREQLKSLQAAARELASLDDSYQEDREQAEEELARLNEMIEEIEDEIDQFDEEQRGKAKSYAIVPYRGPNGTRRRPVYIECRKDEVILQPEGVSLGPIDFRPPLGVGNPLSAALRAARKYYQQQDPDSAFDPDSEPYPLILVRPDGIELYHRVRSALESGDTDFGYEMVDGDWDLEFGLPNPVLANNEAEAVDAARVRRHLLSQAAPTAYESLGPASFDSVSGGRSGGTGVRGLGAAGEQGRPAGNAPRNGGSPPGEEGGVGAPYSSEDTLRYGQPAGGVASVAGVNSDYEANAPGGGGAMTQLNRTAGSREGQPGNPYAAIAEAQASEYGLAADQTTSSAGIGNNGGQQSPSADQAADQTADATRGGDATSESAGQVAGGNASQSGGSPSGSPSSAGASAPMVNAQFGDRAHGSGSGSGSGLGRGRRGDIPIRRTISLVVHQDRVSVTPVDDQGRPLA
ncbi:MAG: hypothetical protein AAF596_09245, partial [Planctomycetota bacterium]